MSQFFADGNLPVDLTGEQREMLEGFNMLTADKKRALLELIKVMK